MMVKGALSQMDGLDHQKEKEKKTGKCKRTRGEEIESMREKMKKEEEKKKEAAAADAAASSAGLKEGKEGDAASSSSAISTSTS